MPNAQFLLSGKNPIHISKRYRFLPSFLPYDGSKWQSCIDACMRCAEAYEFGPSCSASTALCAMLRLPSNIQGTHPSSIIGTSTPVQSNLRSSMADHYLPHKRLQLATVVVLFLLAGRRPEFAKICLMAASKVFSSHDSS